MSRDIEDDFISSVVLIPCIIASHRLYTNFSYLKSRYTTSWMACSPVTYNSKKGGGGETFEITEAASPAIMSETRYSSHS